MSRMVLLLLFVLVSCQQPRQDRTYNRDLQESLYDIDPNNPNEVVNSSGSSLRVPSGASHCDWNTYAENSPRFGYFSYCKSRSNSYTYYFRFKDNRHLCFYLLADTDSDNEIHISDRICEDFNDEEIHEINFALIINKSFDGIMMMERKMDIYFLDRVGRAEVYHHTAYEQCYICLQERFRSQDCRICNEFQNKGAYHKISLD